MPCGRRVGAAACTRCQLHATLFSCGAPCAPLLLLVEVQPAGGSLTNVVCVFVYARARADGTFMPEVGVARRGRAAGGLAVVAVAALAVAMVALVYANTSSEWPGSVLMSEGQRTTKLAWGGFTNQMQEEADKALRLCKVGLLGKKQHCATHVVSTDFTKWTHTDAGQPTWEESQRVLSQQVPCAPLLERASWHRARTYSWSVCAPAVRQRTMRSRTVAWMLLRPCRSCQPPAPSCCRAPLVCPCCVLCAQVPSAVLSCRRALILICMHALQTSVIPSGPDIGTPGDFGDRR